MPDEPRLREQAREAIKSSKLPSQTPNRTWGGPGIGAECSVGRKAILPGAERIRRGPTGMHIECEKTKHYPLAEPEVPTKGPTLRAETFGSLLTRSGVPPVPRSAKMQALIEKIEAADAAHFADLRAKGKAQSDALAKARKKTLERRRENLRMAREIQGAARRMTPPLGEAS